MLIPHFCLPLFRLRSFWWILPAIVIAVVFQMMIIYFSLSFYMLNSNYAVKELYNFVYHLKPWKLVCSFFFHGLLRRKKMTLKNIKNDYLVTWANFEENLCHFLGKKGIGIFVCLVSLLSLEWYIPLTLGRMKIFPWICLGNREVHMGKLYEVLIKITLLFLSSLV
jgi:hypothetical protein